MQHHPSRNTNDTGGDDAPWVALQVRSNMEHTAARHLEYRGYEYFLPLSRQMSGAPDKQRDAPLFPGYVFCRLSQRASAPIVSTPGVSRIVSFGGLPAHVEEHEIESIRRTVGCGQPLVSLPSFHAGMAVLITDGPLRGVRGTVLTTNGKQLLVVSVTLLQRSVGVELPANCVSA